MKDEAWVVVDTETNGLGCPIYTVEIAAQRMRGWEPLGEPFRVLLNQDVPIDPAAQALHGYSREYLRRHGERPDRAHKAFHDYAATLPIVAYSISFDWDRVLLPEYKRLGVPQTGEKGFCAMTLARRVITETENYKLETLKNHFKLSEGPSHKALNDVHAVVTLFQNVFRQRLEPAGIVGFDTVAEFSRMTPIAQCLNRIQHAVAETPRWFVLTEDDKSAGPFLIKDILDLAGDGDCYVWRRGMVEWTLLSQVPDFTHPTPKARKNRKPKQAMSHASSLPSGSRPNVAEVKVCASELLGLCKGIVADGRLDDREIIALHDWMMSCPFTHTYPMSEIADTLERVCEDGVVTEQEQVELLQTINSVLRHRTDERTPSIGSSMPDIAGQRPSRNYYVLNLTQGSPEWLSWRHDGIGASDASAVMGENPWRSPQQLLQEKIYPVAKSTESPEMRRGIELEPAAREEYCRRTGIMVSPICVQHTEHSWIRASLDGMSEAHDHVVEIKCGERSYQLAESGHVAPYYYAQLQHILQVTGLGEIDYWAYIEPGSGILLRVKRDERYIQDLFQEELAFWRHLSEYRAQPT